VRAPRAEPTRPQGAAREVLRPRPHALGAARRPGPGRAGLPGPAGCRPSRGRRRPGPRPPAAGSQAPVQGPRVRRPGAGADGRRAAEGLARLDKPTPEDLAALGEALGSKRPRLRLYAATTLADLGPAAKAALGPLTRAVKDPDPAVRTLAVTALRGLGAEAFP